MISASALPPTPQPSSLTPLVVETHEREAREKAVREAETHSFSSTPGGLDFLRSQGARRMRDYQAQPFMSAPVVGTAHQDGDDEHDIAPNEPRPLPQTTRDYEIAPEKWAPIRAADCGAHADFDNWPLRPRRFVDGKDVGRTVAWLQTPEGFPIPLRLSILGAIAMENHGGQLKRGAHKVEKALTLATDCFPIEQVADFREALRNHNIVLLSVPSPNEGVGFEWERTAGRTRAASRRRMVEMEREVMGLEDAVPTLVDGRLDVHLSGEDAYQTAPVIGLVKSHHVEYFEGESPCWNALYSLEPGKRTPSFVIHARNRPNADVVSWYVRMCGSNGEMPNWGIVRVEVARAFFENGGMDFSALDKWSRLVCAYRCRDETYGRSAVSVHPIVRAEESLGSLFPPLEPTISGFYRRFRI
jgi:hypothetical protein